MIILFLLAILQPTPESGSTLVVVFTGGGAREYHTPACPLVQGVRDVAVMRKAEAEARRLTPHDACHKGPAPKPDPNAVRVFVASGDKYYHRAGCRRLPARNTRVTLDRAGRRHWPCPVCKPPIRKRNLAIGRSDDRVMFEVPFPIGDRLNGSGDRVIGRPTRDNRSEFARSVRPITDRTSPIEISRSHDRTIADCNL